MNKYKLTDETKEWNGRTLHRIEALIDFGDVHTGDKGGWIEEEKNLSVSGNAWVSGNARVYGDAQVYGDARVDGDAQVYGDAWVDGKARVYGDAQVDGDARVYGKARVDGDDDYSTIYGFGTVHRTTTFFRCKDGIVRANCGCFYGTIPEFRDRVKKTRTGKIAEEYLMIADLMEKHFSKEGEHE